MNDRLDSARRLGRRINAGWQREDVEAQLTRLHARRRGRARRWVIAPLAVAGSVAAAVAVFAGVSPGHEPAAPPPVAVALVHVERQDAAEPAPEVVAPVAPSSDSASPPGVLSLGDGSVVTPLAKDSRLLARKEAARVDSAALPAAPEPPASWRDDAVRGDYAAAWTGFARAAAPLDTMEDLLLAGDVARLSGHAAAAVTQLSRAVALHAEDPRAPLAAFTLGRVHLEDLGAPRDAAQAFDRARALAPGGPLAEDALAREVEAWSRAGEAETARARALDYTRRYPQGRRSHAVRRFGGLEAP